ncbi:hypothetical protein TEA_005793 [Camellia sinensis var. sinensis]|uniref:Uncharacterized protein n=1 Tax=Camellia sinensis var. sinensis TaxID=542762 RepID=A0A4S4EG57_CAMSN|nr:hypothetical protein TEA_005793 [Camellia sinensis var. sinensis]
MGIEGEKRYGLLLACKDSEYVKEVYGGYFNVFVAAFGEEGERWDLFRVVEGEFPDMNQLQNYDGFVVSGSPYDAYGNDFWILKLCFLLQTLDSMRNKVLGICFGHQVWEVPVGAEVIAFSDKTRVEMFIIGDHILGIQGHPEYTKDILNNLIDRLLTNDSIEKGFAEDVKSKLQLAEPDRKLLTLDSLRDKDKLPKSFILILVKSPLRLRTLVHYSFISDSDIFGVNLGLAEIISASRPGHVAPRILFHSLHFQSNFPNSQY